jgi:ABC-type transport system involved in cytochrome bd biosynthesis fused ATPase/permease subunit
MRLFRQRLRAIEVAGLEAASAAARQAGAILWSVPVPRASSTALSSAEARKQALIDTDLTIARGSFTVLIGPSGSGKTTLLTLLG